MAQLDAAAHASRQGEIRGPQGMAPDIVDVIGGRTLAAPFDAMAHRTILREQLLAVRQRGLGDLRLRRNFDGRIDRLFFPAIRKRFDVLDHGYPFLGRNVVPWRYGRAPQAVRDRDEQVFVGRQGVDAARGGTEFKNAAGEITRLDLEKLRARALAVALLAVTAHATAQ